VPEWCINVREVQSGKNSSNSREVSPVISRREVTLFSTLAEKLQGVFRKLKGKGKLGEKDVDLALREIRLALLEADVNYKVVRDFVSSIRERALGAKVLKSLTPGQQVVKIVHEDLAGLMGVFQKSMGKRFFLQG
jgi:signal recognition particle GTPase